MKVENQLSFKSARFTKAADIAMSKRLASGEFIAARTDFLRKYDNSAFDITVSTVKENSKRLTAQVDYEGKQVMSDEEGCLTKFFCTPAFFLDKLSEKIDSLETKMFGKRSRGGRSLKV